MNKNDTNELDIERLKGLSRSVNYQKQKEERKLPTRVFLHIDGIGQSSDGFEYAFGTNVLTKEKTKVRLNTLDERVQDIISTGRMKSQQQATEVTKNQYENSAQPRKSLSERSKNNSTILSFDQSFEIQSTDNYKTFRSHWAESISTNPNAQLIIAPAHLQFVNTNNPFGRVEIIEKNFQIDAFSNKDDIKNMFMSALNHEDDYSAERSGNLNYILRSKENNESLFNGSLSSHLNQIDTGRGLIKVPANINITLTKLMKDPIVNNQNQLDPSVIFNHDLNRILVKHLLNQPFSHKLETNDPQLQHFLKTLSAKLNKGEIYLDAYSSRNIFLGKDTVKMYRAKASRSLSPLKIYNIDERDNSNNVVQHKGYLNAVIGIERHSDTLSPFITFTTPISPLDQASKLENLQTPKNQQIHRTILASEEFKKDPLPQSVTNQPIDNVRKSIEESKKLHQQNNSTDYNFGF